MLVAILASISFLAPARRAAGGPPRRGDVRDAWTLGIAEAIAAEEAERRGRAEAAGAEGGAGWFSLGRLFGRKASADAGAAGRDAASVPLAAPSPAPAPEDAGAEEAGHELADALLADAAALEGRGDAEGALAVLGALLERSPDRADARAARGKILLSRREYALAADDYRRAVSTGDGDIESHYGLGTALAKWAEKIEAEGDAGQAGEKYRDAALEYKAVLWRRPDYPPACYSLGCVYARMGKTDDAVYYFRRTLDRVEKDSEMARRVMYNMKLLGAPAEEPGKGTAGGR